MYNIYGRTMRDRDVDQDTGWLSNGLWYDRATRLETGLAGLGRHERSVIAEIPEAGRDYIEKALRDPKARPIVEKLLRSSDPKMALARQAEEDISEAVKPTGKTIVFKDIAAKIAPKLEAAQEAIMEALPSEDTEEGREALEIFRMADDPKAALEQYYTQIALEEVAPDLFTEGGADLSGIDAFDDLDEAIEHLEPLGLGLSVKGKRILKGVGIAAAVVATAGVAAVAAPVVVGAIGAVGKAVVGGVGSIFGAGKPAEAPPTEEAPTDKGPITTFPEEYYRPAPTPKPTPTPEKPAFDLSSVLDKGLNFALEYYKAKKQQAPTKPVDPTAYREMREKLVEKYVSEGMTREMAERYADSTVGQIQQQEATGAPIPEPAKAELIPGVPTWMLLAGAGLFILTARPEAPRRRSRRNPYHRRRR